MELEKDQVSMRAQFVDDLKWVEARF